MYPARVLTPAANPSEKAAYPRRAPDPRVPRKRPVPRQAPIFLAGIAAISLSCAVTPGKPTASAQGPGSVVRQAPAKPVVVLAFSDFFQPGPRLIPTEKAIQSDGKRVRLVGFMARMELSSARAFYLASRPLFCDEAGGGTADLTPDAVRVEVPWAREPAIPFVPGPVEIVGTFHIGSHEEDDGRVSMFRVTLDPPANFLARKASVPVSDKNTSSIRKPKDSRS